MEYQIDTPDHPTVRFHPLCLAVWQAQRAALAAMRG
jgi:hypothetical protein